MTTRSRILLSRLCRWFKPMSKAERMVVRICDALGLSRKEVLSSTRELHVCLARFIISYCLHERCGLTETEIGRLMNRHRTTVIHHLKQYHSLKDTKERNFMKMLAKVKKV